MDHNCQSALFSVNLTITFFLLTEHTNTKNGSSVLPNERWILNCLFKYHLADWTIMKWLWNKKIQRKASHCFRSFWDFSRTKAWKLQYEKDLITSNGLMKVLRKQMQKWGLSCKGLLPWCECSHFGLPDIKFSFSWLLIIFTENAWSKNKVKLVWF